MNTIKVKDLMTRHLITIKAEDSIIKASETMIQNKIGSVLVYENGEPIGIITERDIVRKIMMDCKDLCDVKAIEIASKEIITISPLDSIEHALVTMHRNRIKRIPVKDPDTNKLVGIITTRDVIAAFNTLELV
ncbi:MAG: CBS domain-containing protein [Candidatus Hodarchaeales archaeon]|jgi:CBS domain-containing protein